MNLRDLRYLVAVADHRHFGRAAEACFVTQPTLSTQIKKLETELGVELIERNPRQIILTDAGAQVVERARAILGEADEVRDLGVAGTAGATDDDDDVERGVLVAQPASDVERRIVGRRRAEHDLHGPGVVLQGDRSQVVVQPLVEPAQRLQDRHRRRAPQPRTGAPQLVPHAQVGEGVRRDGGRSADDDCTRDELRSVHQSPPTRGRLA